MKKIIFFVLLLVLIHGGYRYIQAAINFERLTDRIKLIISDPQSHSVKSMKKFIAAEAAKLGTPLAEEDIQITVTDTERASLAEKLIETPTIQVESKLLTIRFRCPVKIYGFTKVFSYDVEKVFTSKASLVVPYIEEPNF